MKELTLSLIEKFNSKETEDNWNDTAVIIKKLSKFVSLNAKIEKIELSECIAQLLPVLEETVSTK